MVELVNNALRADEMDSHSLALLGHYLALRLAFLRRKNDQQLDPITTAKIRGAIDECKYLSNLVEPRIIPGVKAKQIVDVEEMDVTVDRSLRSAPVPERDEM